MQQAAIEMSVEIQAQAQAARDAAVATPGTMSTMELTSKTIAFSSVSCLQPMGGALGCDYSQLDGVSPDLVVRPFGWKGNVPTLRAFSEDAFFGELGMPSDVVTFRQLGLPLPADPTVTTEDIDGDGVTNEVSAAATIRPTPCCSISASTA